MKRGGVKRPPHLSNFSINSHSEVPPQNPQRRFSKNDPNHKLTLETL